MNKSKPTNVELIAFDIGNVLVKYDSVKLSSALALICHADSDKIYNHLFRYGIQTRCELGDMNPTELFEYFRTYLGLFHDIYDFVSIWCKGMQLEPVPGMKELLNDLIKLNYKLAIISNLDSMRWRYLVDTDLILPAKFDNIILSYMVRVCKPDVRIADILANDSKTDKSRILFIDDKIANVRSMIDAGIPSIHFESATDLIKQFKSRSIL